MMNVLRSILLDLPLKLAPDLVEIVEAAPSVEILTYGFSLAFVCLLLCGIAKLIIH